MSSTFQAIAILIVLIGFTSLLMTRKLPTMLGLPLLAIVIAIIAGVPFLSGDPKMPSIASNVLAAGSMRLSGTMAGLIFGAFFGQVLNKTGITKEIIRRAAEMAGDKPLPISLVFLAVASVILAASGGLGMVILVGTIIIPIMLTAGVSPFVASLVMLLGNGIGSVFNLQNWGIYRDVLGVDVPVISSYSWLIGGPLIVVSIFMIVWYTRKEGTRRKAWAMPSPEAVREDVRVKLLALISPIVPIVLVFTMKMEIVSAIIIGMIIAILLAFPKKPIQILSASLIDGLQSVAGAFVLMMGIGMLLACINVPQVAAVFQPVINTILPKSAIAFILFFTLLSPLAIYRGPLNVYGLGSGIAALFIAAGMSPVAAMIGLRAATNMQSVCDPTNTHNVWTTDFTQTDLNGFTRKTMAYVILAIAVTVTVGAFMAFK